MILGLMWVALLFIPLVTLWLFAGLLWAPLAGLIYRRRVASAADGEPTQRPWLTGAAASALLLLPWVYLMLQVKGRAPSARMIKNGYRLLYTAWALGPLCYFMSSPFIVATEINREGPFHPCLLAAAALIILIALMVSRSSYRNSIVPVLNAAGGSGPEPVYLCDRVHTRPFVWAYLCIVLTIGVWWFLPLPEICPDPYGSLLLPFPAWLTFVPYS